MYEMAVGLNIINDEVYSNYRKEMKPLLEAHQGGFRYDFKVSEVLKNEEGKSINRVFFIYFGSKDLMDQFFANPEYLKIKTQFFEKSVQATTILSSYSR